MVAKGVCGDEAGEERWGAGVIAHIYPWGIWGGKVGVEEG